MRTFYRLGTIIRVLVTCYSTPVLQHPLSVDLLQQSSM